LRDLCPCRPLLRYPRAGEVSPGQWSRPVSQFFVGFIAGVVITLLVASGFFLVVSTPDDEDGGAW
jgi:hypothetical protein